jgi:recombinational DNA repair ATPase RecF
VIRQEYRYAFKFENNWLKEEDIDEVVVEGWNSGVGTEIVHRLTHCADKLQRWGRRKKKRFKEEIMEYGAEMESSRGNIDAASVARFKQAQHQHAKTLVQE